MKTAFIEAGTGGHTSRSAACGKYVPSPDLLQCLAASLCRQWKCYRHELRRCQRRFSEAAVHDSRVETRRLLSLIELLDPFLDSGDVKSIRRLLKRHLDTFDALRDTQVQMRLVTGLLKRFSAAATHYAFLLESERSLCRQTRRAVCQIKARRLESLLKACQKRLKRERRKRGTAAVRGRVLGSLHHAFRRIRQLRARIDPQDTRSIHRTRIAFKRYRYMVEMLALHGKLADPNLPERLHAYQTLMGDIQDNEVLLAALKRRLARMEPKSANRLTLELVCRRDRLVRRYLRTAGRLEAFEPDKILKERKSR
jgi:CHAD domain-containing protein